MTIKWIKEEPDFLKIEQQGHIITLKNSNDLKEEFANYAYKYKESANLITKHILEKADISKLDVYFFPVAYLYRHSLELILKAIGFNYITDYESRKDYIKESFHNLSILLSVVGIHGRDIVAKEYKAFQWLEKLFNDMDEIDKESDSFRYPFRIVIERDIFNYKKYGTKSFWEKQIHINLINFANRMEIAFHILESYLLKKDIETKLYKSYSPKFLEEGGYYYSQSVIGYGYNRDKFFPYVRAYTNTAKYIYSCIAEDKKLAEMFFIPMCYLYRNGIELAMKEILFEESSYGFEKAIKKINNKKHSVQRLWNLIKNDVENHAQPPKEDKTLAYVERYINQLHSFDDQSDKFRYPTDKYLKLHFKKPVKLDIENVVNFFSELGNFLNGVNLMMAFHNESLAEMEAEYEKEMRNYNDWY